MAKCHHLLIQRLMVAGMDKSVCDSRFCCVVFQSQRLQSDLIVCVAVTIFVFAVHVSTAFTSPGLQVSPALWFLIPIRHSQQTNGIHGHHTNNKAPELPTVALIWHANRCKVHTSGIHSTQQTSHAQHEIQQQNT